MLMYLCTHNAGKLLFTGEKLRVLDNKAYEIMKFGHRKGTRKNKVSQMKIYNTFCGSHSLNPLPADEWQLIRYAVYTADHVMSQGTVKNYVGE